MTSTPPPFAREHGSRNLLRCPDCRRIWLAVGIAAAMLVTAGVTRDWGAEQTADAASLNSASATATPPIVAVAIEPHRWIAERLVGADAIVRVAIPAGSSCCGHQPTDHAIEELAAAAVYFRAGVPAERAPWLERGVMPRVQSVVDLSTTVGTTLGGGAADDSHAWTSPSALRAHARAMVDTLIHDPAFDALDEDALARRHADLDRALDALESRTAERLRPFRGRQIWVDHPAWARLASEHGIEQVVIDADATNMTDHRIDRLLNDARSRGISHVFVQPQHPGRIARRIADAVDAEVIVLDPFERNPIDGVDRAVDAFVLAMQQAADSRTAPRDR
ncbi:MAG: metal ABC transporter solute-binding protein, Zn/Mn family [Phycisphaerales bacterium]